MKSGKRKRSGDLITSRDIIFGILLRLPTKSLMHLKAARKFWNSIISDDPDFAKLHRKTWIENTRLLFHPTRTEWEYCIYKVKENGTKVDKSQCLPYKFWEWPRVIGFKHSLGALLLFITGDIPPLLVYDSFSGNQILLPDLPRRSVDLIKAFLMYDASTNMHKVLVYRRDLRDSEYVRSCCITSFCIKTMAREHGWRMIPAPFEGQVSLWSNISIKGIMYWLVTHRSEEKFIKLFDIAEEKFLNLVECPEEISEIKTSHYKYDLRELRELLGFTLMTYKEFRIWVLTDSDNSSWELLYKISLESMFGCQSWRISRVVLLLENIRSLPSILLINNNEYYWYEMDGEKARLMNFEDCTLDNIGSLAAWVM